jgi:hypothetical protein
MVDGGGSQARTIKEGYEAGAKAGTLGIGFIFIKL